MDSIFHEIQQGRLCAQHCLNTLLQNEIFNAVALAEIAKELDEEEARQLSEGGESNEDYHKFRQKPSQNVDETGYFSIQVLQRALKVWNLEMIPYNSKDSLALSLQEDPTKANAYICNQGDHWYTIRKFHCFWFNLNSCLAKPRYISNTYLSLLLKQLQVEGQSIFIIKGTLPPCAGDKFFAANPDYKFSTPLTTTITKVANKQEIIDLTEDEEEEKALKKAMELSQLEMEKQELEIAIRMSLNDQASCSRYS